MASRNLGTLTIDLVAKVAGFTQGMTAAERSSDKWRKQVEKDAKAVGSTIATSMAAAVTAVVATTAVLTKQGLDAVNAQATLAKSLDTTFDSITALQLAAGDVGLDGLEGSITRLNRRLGAAEVGSGAAASAVKALNLDLQALSNMDVDERVATIADAIRDSGVSMQRAARFAQDLGFEQQQAAEFFTQGGDAIRAYRGQVEALGLSLSDIDAQKVIDAQNAMGVLGDVTRSVSQQLAVQLSPIITQISSDLESAAIQAGGFSEEIQGLLDGTLRASAFVIDAIDGVGRTFTTVGKGIALWWLILSRGAMQFADDILNDPVDALNALIEVANRIPGIDIEPVGLSELGGKVRSQIEMFSGAIAIAKQDISEGLLEPLAGERLLQYYEDAKVAAQDAAAAAVELGKAAGGSGSPLEDPALIKEREASEKSRLAGIAKEITALERAAATWGMSSDAVKIYDLTLQGAEQSQLGYAQSLLDTVSALEAQAAVNTEFKSIADSLQTEEESVLASYDRRRQIILNNTLSTGEERAELLRRLEEQSNEELLSINGSYWERWLQGAEENLTSFDEISGSVLEGFTGRFGDAFESMLFDAQTFGDAAKGIFTGLARSAVNALGEMIAQEAALLAIQKLRPAAAAATASAEIAAITATTAASAAATATTTATQATAAATTAVAWTPAAIAASIGSFGTAAAVGLAAVIAAMAFSGGFKKGGYTGGSSPDEARGIVHGKEYVFDAASTARIGVSNLDAMRAGRSFADDSSSRVGQSLAGVDYSSRSNVSVILNNAPAGTSVREQAGANGEREFIIDVVTQDLYSDGPIRSAVGAVTGTQYQGS